MLLYNKFSMRNTIVTGFILSAVIILTLSLLFGCSGGQKPIEKDAVYNIVENAITEHSEYVMSAISRGIGSDRLPAGLKEYLDKHYLFLVSFRDRHPGMIAGKAYIPYNDIANVSYDFGTIHSENTAYFYRKLMPGTYLFFLIYSENYPDRISVKLPPYYAISPNIKAEQDSAVFSYNEMPLFSIVKADRTSISLSFLRNNTSLFILLLLISVFLIKKIRHTEPAFPFLYFLGHFILLYSEGIFYLRFFLYISLLIMAFRPFRRSAESSALRMKLVYMAVSASIVLLYINHAGMYISYDKLIFYAILFNINLFFIMLLRALKANTAKIAVIVLLLNMSLSLVLIMLYESELNTDIMLKLKTISYDEHSISKIIAMDLFNSLNKEILYERLLSGKTSKLGFETYRDSLASFLKRDITVILFDSMGKITERFSLREPLNYLNVESYIQDIFLNGKIDHMEEHETKPDIYIRGELLIKDTLIGGGILILCSLDYFCNDLQSVNMNITEALFSHQSPKPEWIRPLLDRSYYYLVIKNTNIIHSSRNISFEVPQDFYEISAKNGPISQAGNIIINKKSCRAYYFKQKGRPLLVFLIEDYDIYYFIFAFINNISLSLAAFFPLLIMIAVPRIRERVDIHSLRTRIGFSTALLSLIPVLMVFYILQSALSNYFSNYHASQVQKISFDIKESISLEINKRSELILKSRILEDFISGRIQVEGLERYLLGHFQDTPINGISIKNNQMPVYERQENISIHKESRILEGILDYKSTQKGLYITIYKKVKDIEAIFIFELTRSFLEEISGKFSADLGFADKSGFISLSTFDFLMYSGIIPYNQGAGLLDRDIHPIKIKGQDYYISSKELHPRDTSLIVIKQLMPVYLLQIITRFTTIIFSFVLLIVVIILTKTDSLIAGNINSFIKKLNMIREEKLKSVNTDEINLTEFKRVANMMNELLNTIYKSNLITDTLIKSIPVAILLLDSENNTIHSNKIFDDWAKLLEDQINSFLDDSSINTAVFPVFSSGRNKHKQVFKLDKYPIEMKDNKTANLIMITDISSLLELEEAKLRTKMAEKFAHDIKNPLMPIKLYVQHLSRLYERDRDKFTSDFAATADTILSQVEIIESILLRYARIKKEESRLDKIHRLGDIFQSLKNSFIFHDGKIEVSFVVNDPDSKVLIDYIEFFNAISNLIRNSVESLKGKGRIIITESITGKDLSICIKDNGPGIPESILKIIKTSGNASSKAQGFGIGLQLAKDFAEMMNGNMAIQSDKNGTEIIIILPGIVQ